MDEPRKHPIFMLLLAIVALGSVPFFFIGRDFIYFLGLPLWLWSSVLFTFSFSCLTAWGILRYWKDDRLD